MSTQSHPIARARLNLSSVLCSLACLSLAAPALAQQNQVVKPAYTQYWMDVATVSMAGMDDMPAMGGGGGLGGLIGGAIGGAIGLPGMGGNNFGATRGMFPGRWLDLAVVTQRKPEGTDASQAIPAGQKMGPNLNLLPVKAASAKSSDAGGSRDDVERPPEKPKGRMLFYWGCSEKVRAGQPRVLDFANASLEDFGKFMQGRAVRDRGAKAEPGHSVWPNEKNRQNVPKDASLLGAHEVTGEGLPATLKFTLGQQQDFMPRLDLTGEGGGARATQLRWTEQPTAQAYFLMAMGGGQDEMVIWSSSEVPEPGWGLMDYASNANVEKWLKDKVLLPSRQTQCAIPEGVFAKAQGAMLRGIAYGHELNLVHPPRPADKRVPWEQEWVARVRVKSVAMLPLGDEDTARGGSRTRNNRSAPGNTETPPNSDDSGNAKDKEKDKKPGLEDLGKALKGIFSR